MSARLPAKPSDSGKDTQMLEYSLERLGTTQEEVEMLEGVAENVRNSTGSAGKALQKVLETEVANNDNYDTTEELRSELETLLDDPELAYDCEKCDGDLLEPGHKVVDEDKTEFAMDDYDMFDNKTEVTIYCPELKSTYTREAVTQQDRLFTEGQEQ